MNNSANSILKVTNEMGTSSATIGSIGDRKTTRSSANLVEIEVVSERKRNKTFRTKVKGEEEDEKKEMRLQKGNKGRQVVFADEVDSDNPTQLVEVVEVESYKKYNEPFPGNFCNRMINLGKAYCNCSCLVY